MQIKGLEVGDPFSRRGIQVIDRLWQEMFTTTARPGWLRSSSSYRYQLIHVPIHPT